MWCIRYRRAQVADRQIHQTKYKLRLISGAEKAHLGRCGHINSAPAHSSPAISFLSSDFSSFGLGKLPRSEDGSDSTSFVT